MSTSNATVKFVGDLRGFVNRMTRTMVDVTFAEYPAEIREILTRNIVDLAVIRDAASNPGYEDDATRLAVIRQVLAENEAWYAEADEDTSDDHNATTGTDPADTELPAPDRPEDPDAGAAPPDSQKGEPDA
jgi:hypothetical protein